MSLSLEPPLYTSTVEHKGKTSVSKMPVPISNPEPFSKGAMQELMYAAQQAMLGKKYNKLDMYNKYRSELTQSAPYQIRVYVLAEHNYEQKNVLNMSESEAQDFKSTCKENTLLEIKKINFFPDKNIIDSVLEAAN